VHEPQALLFVKLSPDHSNTQANERTIDARSLFNNDGEIPPSFRGAEDH
jgi:hypothetical protein